MTTALHAAQASGRWFELTVVEQMANIGTEVARAARAKSTGNADRFDNSFDRALELFDLSLADGRWSDARRREIARAREVVCDFLVGENEITLRLSRSTPTPLPFAMAVRRDL